MESIFYTWSSKTRQISKIQGVHHITVTNKMQCPHLLLICFSSTFPRQHAAVVSCFALCSTLFIISVKCCATCLVHNETLYFKLNGTMQFLKQAIHLAVTEYHFWHKSGIKIMISYYLWLLYSCTFQQQKFRTNMDLVYLFAICQLCPDY